MNVENIRKTPTGLRHTPEEMFNFDKHSAVCKSYLTQLTPIDRQKVVASLHEDDWVTDITRMGFLTIFEDALHWAFQVAYLNHLYSYPSKCSN